jgi:hypothetical protein
MCRSLGLFFIVLMLSGCSGLQDMLKGDQGSEGPSLSGRWVGRMYLVTQEGTLAADHSGITVTLTAPISLASTSTSSLPVSVETDASGKFVLPDMVTGLYSLTFSKENYGTLYYYNMSFTGGGDQIWSPYEDIPFNPGMTQVPDFEISTFNLYSKSVGHISLEVFANIQNKSRSLVAFWSTSPEVSSQNYMGSSLPYSSPKSFSETGETMLNFDGNFSSLPIYVQIYPVSPLSGGSEGVNLQWPGTYTDPLTNKIVFTSLGTPSETLRIE